MLITLVRSIDHSMYFYKGIGLFGQYQSAVLEREHNASACIAGAI